MHKEKTKTTPQNHHKAAMEKHAWVDPTDDRTLFIELHVYFPIVLALILSKQRGATRQQLYHHLICSLINLVLMLWLQINFFTNHISDIFLIIFQCVNVPYTNVFTLSVMLISLSISNHVKEMQYRTITHKTCSCSTCLPLITATWVDPAILSSGVLPMIRFRRSILAVKKCCHFIIW